MSEYTLITTIIFLLLSILWGSSNILNVVIKASLICLTVWGAYLMFGPAQLISKFAV